MELNFQDNFEVYTDSEKIGDAMRLFHALGADESDLLTEIENIVIQDEPKVLKWKKSGGGAAANPASTATPTARATAVNSDLS